MPLANVLDGGSACTRMPGLLDMQAALRACECLGIQDVWLIGTAHQPEDVARLPADGPSSPANSDSRHSTAGAAGSAAAGEDPAQWLTVRSFATTQDCVAALAGERCRLWCTDLSQSAEVLDAVLRDRSGGGACTREPSSLAPDGLATAEDEAPARRLAVAFGGSEAEGVSQELREEAEKLVYLPLHGVRRCAAAHKCCTLGMRSSAPSA